MAFPHSHVPLRIPLLVTFVLGLAAGSARADICLAIDERRDMFSPRDRDAALLLLQHQFELAGERVVAPGCAAEYVVSHVQLGTVINITLAGPNGQRDATAIGMEDVPAVYSQMVRSLLRGVPMTAAGVVDRTNVTRSQETHRRVSADSLAYARLGYAGMFGDRTYAGPTVTVFGYRKELDSFALDVSFASIMHQSVSGDYGVYGIATGSTGTTSTWLKMEALRFLAPQSDRSTYAGGGLSWSAVDLDHDYTSWSGSGLQGELTLGYELARASSLRVFFQADGGLPFFRLRSERHIYPTSYPYVPTVIVGHRYVPSLTLSLGFGWQRGGGH